MILVTGSTGTIGGELLRLLGERDISCRALVRTPDKAEGMRAHQIEAVVGDFADPASLDRVFEGISRVFLLSAAHERQAELQLNAIAAAKRAGVGYIVKVSVIGAAPDAPIKLGRDHATVERGILDAGITAAILRPHSFMQNVLGSAPIIVQKGEFYGSTGDAKAPLIDARDVAAAAATFLSQPSAQTVSHTLTGPEAISNDEIAHILGDVMGKPVRYVDIPGEQLKAGMVAAGMPEWLATDLLTLNEMWARGMGLEVSNAVPLITGRPGRTFQEFVRDYAAAFREAA